MPYVSENINGGIVIFSNGNFPVLQGEIALKNRRVDIIYGARRKRNSMTEQQANFVGRTFRYFKGNLYRLEGFAKDSETLEEMVVYRALYGEGGLWVRPAKMFFEAIERDGRTMKRFEPVEDA